ncbi:putative receptor-like cytosolic serine/threonine-protein kinase RBK1 isoform X1 [Iris pallida]|uniref:Receptor-like cytosolic serine/threonine-protein kinase RBK1 isoform X1 n=1 Tax=Iris pallida TaxID=29817 RepID=A0AAX6FCU7_IRIPA|nr:putative receptor-like cytosolic serine/threonine-protein kinase RBK1 isoform X1 [Iris pallida]
MLLRLVTSSLCIAWESGSSSSNGVSVVRLSAGAHTPIAILVQKQARLDEAIEFVRHTIGKGLNDGDDHDRTSTFSGTES